LDRHIEASSAFCGIRLMTNWHPDPDVARSQTRPGVLTSAEFLAGFKDLAERRLTFDAWVYSDQLHEVATLAREYPQTQIVLDHLGTPVGALGPFGRHTGQTERERADIVSRWTEGIAELSTFNNITIKLSGIAFPALGNVEDQSHEYPNAAAAPKSAGFLIESALRHFGDRRALFGSNFPIDKPFTSYRSARGAVESAVAKFGNQALTNVFRNNPIEVYAARRQNP
jgi:predicted TIM-barrel fold metal-dependent hydrolase